MNYFRSILFYIGYGLWLILFTLIFLPLALMKPVNARFSILNVYNHVMLAWFKCCCNVKIKVKQEGSIPEANCIVVANHQSEWETMYLQLLKQPMCTILKKELLNVPIFGWTLRATHPIAIDRRHPVTALKKILKEGVMRLKSGFSLLIFPQGTRIAPGQWKSFNKSAFLIACQQNCPIVPVAHNSAYCWGSPGWVKKSGTIEVVIGQAIWPNDKTVEALASEVEQWIKAKVESMP